MKILKIISKISLSAELVLLIVFYEYFNITIYGSLFAFFLMISPMLNAFDMPRSRRADFKYDGNGGKLVFIRPRGNLTERLKYGLVMTYYLSPLHLPIIFFFSDIVKVIAIFVIYIVLMASLTAFFISTSVRNRKLNEADEAKRLKAQKEKEELGKFR